MIVFDTSRLSTPMLSPSPAEFDSTTIIGASATMGMVWLITAQGITLRSSTRNCTIPTASSTPTHQPEQEAR